VVFIIENNEYAMGTSVKRTSNVHELYTLGEAYDMPGMPVNGMRCEDVHEAVEKACAYARQGAGPYLLEIKTYRYRGHSMSDPQKYRSKEEVEEYKQKDPLEDVRKKLLANGWASEPEIDAMDEAVKKQVEEAVKFAEESPYPPAEELWKDVYKQDSCTGGVREGLRSSRGACPGHHGGGWSRRLSGCGGRRVFGSRHLLGRNMGRTGWGSHLHTANVHRREGYDQQRSGVHRWLGLHPSRGSDLFVCLRKCARPSRSVHRAKRRTRAVALLA
jgi:hypothetical protein